MGGWVGGVQGGAGGGRSLAYKWASKFEAIYRWKAERVLAYATDRIDVSLIRLDEIYHIRVVLFYCAHTNIG